MTTIALSEGQRLLLDGLAMGKVLDHVPAPVLILHDDGMAWLNAAARELDDWLKVGDPSRSLMQEIGPALQPVLTALDRNDSPQVLRAPLRQHSGAERAYRAILVDASSAGRPEACSAVILAATGPGEGDELQADVLTELARARLEEAQRQLLQADRLSTIGQLAAGVAHEINNPIGYVQSNLETLRDYVSSLFRLISTQDAALRQFGQSHATQIQQIEKVREEIDFDFLSKDLPTLLAESQEGVSRVRKIIQDLREFSRAGHAEDWTLADIHAGIDSTINIVWNDLKYKVELIKEYGDLPPVECLPSQINQVIMNIVVNGAHAIQGPRGRITIRTGASGDHVWIEIADNGCGIPKAIQSRIFDPFFTTKPIGTGTGLGLSLSYGIIQKHGGRIEVDSEEGVGTTFRIHLPVRHVEEEDRP